MPDEARARGDAAGVIHVPRGAKPQLATTVTPADGEFLTRCAGCGNTRFAVFVQVDALTLGHVAKLACDACARTLQVHEGIIMRPGGRIDPIAAPKPDPGD